MFSWSNLDERMYALLQSKYVRLQEKCAKQQDELSELRVALETVRKELILASL
jgi:hypothetical protein